MIYPKGMMMWEKARHWRGVHRSSCIRYWNWLKKGVWENLLLEGSVDFHFDGFPEMLELENQRNDVERKVLVREGKHSKIMEGLWLLVVARDVKAKKSRGQWHMLLEKLPVRYSVRRSGINTGTKSSKKEGWLGCGQMTATSRGR